MTDDGPDSLILQERLDNLTSRVSGVEGVIGLLVTQTAALHQQMDRFDRRLEQIERRLNLVET